MIFSLRRQATLRGALSSSYQREAKAGPYKALSRTPGSSARAGGPGGGTLGNREWEEQHEGNSAHFTGKSPGQIVSREEYGLGVTRAAHCGWHFPAFRWERGVICS